MIKFLKVLLLSLLAPLGALAQNGTTTVHAIVKDPTGALYVSSQVGASFFDPGTPGKLPLLNGSTFQKSFTGYGTDSFGFFSMTLPDNGVIDSSSGTVNTQWNFTICYKDRQTCFTYRTSINCAANLPTTCSSNSMDISAILQAIAALLPSGPGGGSPAQGPLYTVQASNGAGQFQVTTITDNIPLSLVTIGDNLLESGTLTVTGSSTLNNPLTVNSTALITGKATINGDSQITGPNPGADVRGFGKFATFSSSTATTNGTAIVTIAGASNFKNNEYVTIYNAGPSCSLSTPGTPTLTPSVNGGGVFTVAAGAGSSSFAYKVVAADKFGCYTPASTSISTATGNPIGVQTFTISTLTRANNLVTVTTTATHNYVVGELVHIKYFTTTDGSFEGFWIVNTVPTGTTFTFTSGMDTRFGATTSATGGTVLGFNANLISWTAVPGAWKYYIYGRTGGTFALLGQTLLNYYVDYGSPMNDNQTFPTYIPTTAPITGANDHLTAKINSGGGTLALTLASAASVSISSPIQSDDGPALIAAANSATNIYIPSQGLNINSYTILPSGRHYKFGGGIQASHTIESSGASVFTYEGVGGGSAAGWGPGASIAGSAYPQLVLGNNDNYERIFFVCTAFNGCLNTVDSLNATEISFDYVQFSTGQGTTVDYIGMNQLFKGGGFAFRYSKVLFTTGSPGPNDNTNIGNSPIPSVQFLPRDDSITTNNTFITSAWFTQRGSINVATGLGGVAWFIAKDIEAQSASLPFFQFSKSVFGNGVRGGIDIENLLGADRATAYVGNYQSNNYPDIWIKKATCGTGGRAILTGLPFIGIVANGTCNLGHTTGILSLGGGFGPAVYTDGVIQASSLGYPMSTPAAAPGVVVSAGGSANIGVVPYVVQFLDANGFYGAQSPSVTATTSPGNQTVTITRPTAPVGAVSWVPFADGGAIPCSPVAVATTVYVFNSVKCSGVNPPAQASSVSIGSGGVNTPTLNFWNNAFITTTDFPTPLTTNRTIHIPNASGTLAFIDLAQTFSAKQTFSAATSTTFGDFPVQTSPGNPSAGNIRIYGDSGSGNLTCLTSAGASCIPSGGAGTPGGSSGQVQVNVAGSFGGSVSLTYTSPALSLGSAAGATGQLKLLGLTSGTVTLQSQDIAGTWTFKLPTNAGTANFPLITDGSGNSSWTLLPVAGGGTGAGTFTANQLLAGNGTGALQPLVGSLTGTNPVITFTAQTASAVPLAVNTASSPTGDTFQVFLNSVKTAWFDSSAFLHTPQTLYTGIGPLTLSGSEGTCGAVLAGADIICLGDSSTHDGQLSVNGGPFKPMVQSSTGNPTAFGVTGWSNTFPQLVASGAGLSGQAFLSGGAAAFGNYGALNLAGGATIFTGILPPANGGTGAASLAAANIMVGSGAFVLGDCLKSGGANLVVDQGTACGGGGGSPPVNTIVAATGSSTINNTVFTERFNYALTGSQTGFIFGEQTAATGANNIILQATTNASSTAKPFQADNNGNGVSMSSVGVLSKLGTGSNNADAINGTAFSGTNGDVVSFGASNTPADSGTLAANLVTASSNASAAKQIAISAGANKALSYIDFPQPVYVPAANCVNAVAGSGWSTSATPAALCRAGTNNKDGLLSPWGASDVGYFKVHLPNDWDSAASLDISIDLTSTDTVNAHTIIMQAATSCAKGDGSTTDDVAFNTAQSFGTITLNGNANRTWNATLTGLTKTGCIAGSTLWIKISRTTDTATNVGVYGATVDVARLLTVQAN